MDGQEEHIIITSLTSHGAVCQLENKSTGPIVGAVYIPISVLFVMEYEWEEGAVLANKSTPAAR